MADSNRLGPGRVFTYVVRSDPRLIKAPSDQLDARLSLVLRDSCPGWARTSANRINSAALYQLSYGAEYLLLLQTELPMSRRFYVIGWLVIFLFDSFLDGVEEHL